MSATDTVPLATCSALAAAEVEKLMDSVPALDNTFGAILLGTFISCILYGLTTHQTYRYFRLYPSDLLSLKFMVAFLWVLDTIHSITAMHTCYFYLVKNYARPQELLTGVWTLRITVAISSFVTTVNHLFFARRVYMIGGRNKTMTCIIIFLALVRTAMGIAATVETFVQITFERFQRFTWLVSVSFGTSLLSDVIITASVSWYLQKSRTGFRKTDSIIDVLLVYTINTGLLTSLFTLADLICAVIMPRNLIYIALYFVISKLYANSLLAVLNSRRSLRDKGAEGFETGSIGLEITPPKIPKKLTWADRVVNRAFPPETSVINIHVTETREMFNDEDRRSKQVEPPSSRSDQDSFAIE